MTLPTCEETQRAAMAERHGERSTLEAAQVEGHLASCDECRKALEADAAVRVAFGDRVRAMPPSTPSWPRVAWAIGAQRRARGGGFEPTVRWPPR